MAALYCFGLNVGYLITYIYEKDSQDRVVVHKRVLERVELDLTLFEPDKLSLCYFAYLKAYMEKVCGFDLGKTQQDELKNACLSF